MHGSSWVAAALASLAAGVTAVILGIAAPAASTGTIAVTGNPLGVAVAPAGGYAYAFGGGTTPSNGNLARIDIASGAVTNITVPEAIRDFAVDPAGVFGYAAHTGFSSVSKIALATGAVVATIPVAMGAEGIAIDPAGAFAYVTHLETMSKIALSSFTVVASIPITWPGGKLVIDRAGAVAYVVSADRNNGYAGTLTKVNLATGAIVARIPVSTDPTDVELDPAGRFAYVVHHQNPGIVAKVDLSTNTIVATYTVGREPIGIALDPAGSFAFATNSITANSSTSTLSRIDLATGAVTSTPVGSQPLGLAVDGAGAFAYVANLSSRSVSKVDLAMTPQTVTWNPTTAVTTKASPLALTGATTTGDGEIAFAVTDPGTTGCSVARREADTVLQFSRAGSCVVTATAVASFNHPAATVTRTFTIVLEPSIVTWNPALTFRADTSPVAFAGATATSTALGAFPSYAVTSAGTTGCAIPSAGAPGLTFTGAGSCTVTATFPAVSVYAATTASRTFTILPAPAPAAAPATAPATGQASAQAPATATALPRPAVVTASARTSTGASGKSVQITLALPVKRGASTKPLVVQIYRPPTARTKGSWVAVGTVTFGRDGVGVLRLQAKTGAALVGNGAKLRLVDRKSSAVLAGGTFRGVL